MYQAASCCQWRFGGSFRTQISQAARISTEADASVLVQQHKVKLETVLDEWIFIDFLWLQDSPWQLLGTVPIKTLKTIYWQVGHFCGSWVNIDKELVLVQQHKDSPWQLLEIVTIQASKNSHPHTSQLLCWLATCVGSWNLERFSDIASYFPTEYYHRVFISENVAGPLSVCDSQSSLLAHCTVEGSYCTMYAIEYIFDFYMILSRRLYYDIYMYWYAIDYDIYMHVYAICSCVGISPIITV